MIFSGISRIFSTENDEQYETIGAFWDELSRKHGKSNLRGLGYNWTGTTIEYVIGFKEGEMPGANVMVTLPDRGWKSVKGKIDCLGEIYEKIYENGALLYEIEMFSDDENCEILYFRNSKMG